jgi:hypothetical protein
MVKHFGIWFYADFSYDPSLSARELERFNRLALLPNARGHMTSTRPGARRLGAGAPLTILRFAPLARLHPVLGFHALYCVCARFN